MATSRSTISAPPPPTRSPRTDDGDGRGRGKKRAPRKRTVWHKIGAFFQFLFLLVLIIVLAVIAGVAYLLKQTPKTIDVTFNPPGLTMIYSSDGTPLAEYFVENRRQVSIDQIPLNLQNATIAFEDRRFRQHQGVDIQGIGRAVWSNIRHSDLHGEGGSTITQQLARNLGVQGLNRNKTIERKLKEWLVANQIEHSYTKNQILEMYLNEVNYGAGAYGVEAAAETYFGKHVKDLNLQECALLAGLPNRPTYFNPYRDKELAEKQRNIVLDHMLQEGYIKAQQWQDAKASPIKLASPHAPKLGSHVFHAPFFVSYVYQQLKDRYGEQYLKDGNIKVYTTLNWPMQQAAEDAIKQGLDNPEVKGPQGPSQACLVAMDPKTGEIKAMVGGRDYSKSQYNIATMARRQPGSCFKAILYSAAIDSGLLKEDSTVEDSPITFHMAGGETWSPKDDNRFTYRRVTLREAMAQSINVPAVRVMTLVKPPTVVQYARLMGITSPLDPVLSLALGSSAVTPMEMVDAYATFPNGGNHVDPISFTAVQNADGETLDTIVAGKPTKVLSLETTQQLDDMLRAVTTEGTGASVSRDPEVPEARGKTGTTQDHRDAWFIGYTPRLVCGVWAGHPTVSKNGNPLYGQPMAGNAWGATLCVPIWKNFMLKAEPIFIKAQEREAALWKSTHKGAQAAKTDQTADNHDSQKDDNSKSDRPKRKHKREDFITHNTDGTVTVNIDNDTGLIAPPGSPNSQPVNFADGQEPQQVAPQYAEQIEGSGSTPKPRHSPLNTNDNSGNGSTDQTSTPAAGDGATDTTNGTDTVPSTDSTNGTTPTDDSSTPTVTSSPISDNGSGTSQDPSISQAPAAPRPRHHPRRHIEKPKEYVTVYINPDDGLLATKWTPEQVPRTYVKGTEPHRYTNMYPPPDGEH